MGKDPMALAIIGFTGTKDGMTESQKSQLRIVLADYVRKFKEVELHHGDCVGADEEANHIAKHMGCRRVIHPPDICYMQAYCGFENDELEEGAEIRDPFPFLIRNGHIVDESHYIVAAPKQREEITRSGTWFTIRLARKRNKPLKILWP